jgi:hypothetical protein
MPVGMAGGGWWQALMALVHRTGDVAADASARPCVILCDVPELSKAMDAFLPDLRHCSGEFVFVDPNIGRRSVKFVRKPTYARLEDVPIQRYSLAEGRRAESKVPRYWGTAGVSQYTGIPLNADSPLLAAAVRKATDHTVPFKIVDGGCPGTYRHEERINEGVFYSQVAAVMGPGTEFLDCDGTGVPCGTVQRYDRAQVETLATFMGRGGPRPQPSLPSDSNGVFGAVVIGGVLWMVLVIGWGCCWWQSLRARARAPSFSEGSFTEGSFAPSLEMRVEMSSGFNSGFS